MAVNILVVDDSAVVRSMIIRTLRLAGIPVGEVHQAGNGRDAWEAVRFLKPDTVILDIRMPGSSGITLLKQIKARYPEMNVIMLTNFDYAQYRRQCRLLGADHFLNKTLESETIVETITGSPRH